VTALALTLALAACGGERAQAADPQATDAVRWRLETPPIVRIGADNGGQSLHRVAGATRLADGRIAIANGGSHQVRVFGTDGRLVRDIGRVGDGPGEFRSLAWVGARGDTLVVWDIVASRISRFLIDGTFLTSTIPQGVGMFAQVVGAYPDGSLLFSSDMPDGDVPAAGVRRGRVLLLRVSVQGALMDTVAMVPATEQFVSASEDGRGLRIESLPFGRRTVVALSGDVLYVGTGEDAGIRVAGRNGAISDEVLRVPAARKRVTGADIDAYWKNLVTVGERRGARSGDVRPRGDVPYPDELPPYAALNADRAGRLWIGESRLPREWERPATWWVYTPDGRLTATIQLPPRLHVLDVGEDWLLARERDQVEREMVSVYRITPIERA
jgi:hypothetical protein